MIYIIIYLYVMGVLATMIIEYPSGLRGWVYNILWFITIPVVIIWAFID